MRAQPLVLAFAWVLTGCAAAPPAPELPPAAPPNVNTQIGFRDPEALREHFSKHGREFGQITQPQYLLMAQTLRDSQADGKAILIAYRPDGVITKFDFSTGGFLAYNRDKVIRTFFKPNDGVRYFNRQKGRN
ncbi:MAG: hypothetical protein JNM28_12145 [Armatimonadetes bacterium]|nr:hypothetical protein [Armatimonadota bacterium]MBS1710172.1 hypothetical protein [Armatimonadota bacterium]MBX3110062.1 hypothetical protein [Fimbriimonadaceae bacterium]